MSISVYSYGVHYKWAKHLPEVVVEQLRLAHDLREHMVNVERDYEAAKAAVWSSFPDVAVAESQIAAAEAGIEAALDAISDERKKQRTKNISGPAALAAKEALTAAKQSLKKARAARKAAVGVAFDNGGKEALATAVEAKREAEKATYAEYVQGRGLYYTTQHDVLVSHATAVKNITAKKKAGVYAELRHHAFDGTGVLVVDIKKAVGDRSPAMAAEPSSPFRNVFHLPYLNPMWETMTGAQRRKGGRLVARMRVGGNGEIVDLPIQMHRPLPHDAAIKGAKLVIRKIGTRTVANLNIMVETQDPIPVDDDPSRVSVHFGWRGDTTTDGSEGVRVMTWSADTEFSNWNDVAHNPRYPALNRVMKIASDGMSGAVALPAAMFDRLDASHVMRSERDLAADAMREQLAEWLTEHGPVDHPTRIDRETGLPEVLTAAKVRQWKNPKRLVHLAFGWTPDRAVPGGSTDANNGTEIAEALEAWRIADKRMLDSEAGQRKRAAGMRDDLYAQIAALFVDSYGTIAMDDVSYTELAALPNADETITNEMAAALGRRRASAAVGTLRAKIVMTAKREGVAVVVVETAGVSNTHTCGHVNEVEGFAVTCGGCGVTYDIDSNAVNVIGARAA